MPNMRKLKQIIDDYIDGKLPSIKIVLLEDFSNELGNILNSYQKTSVLPEEVVEKNTTAEQKIIL